MPDSTRRRPPPIELLATGRRPGPRRRHRPDARRARPTSVEAALRRHLARAKPNAYLCLQAYIAPTPERDAALARIRTLLRDRTGRATTTRATGRASSTRPASCTRAARRSASSSSSRRTTRRIVRSRAGRTPSAQLIDAQAAGDFGVLESHQLPVLRVHLEADPDAGLAALERALDDACSPARDRRRTRRARSASCARRRAASASRGRSKSANPLRQGLRLERVPDPCVVVLFGATGDLAHRKVLPALYQLRRTNLLPHEFMLVAVGRRPYEQDVFRQEIAASLANYSRVPGRGRDRRRVRGPDRLPPG